MNLSFHVSNLQEAVTFYERLLGSPKSRWANYAVFDVCGMMLGLELGGRRGVKRVPDIYLQVDNVDETYRELESKGVKFIAKPKDQSWGSRTAKFADPDGNKIILVQIKKSE